MANSPTEDWKHALKLYRTALALAFDFIDLELTWPKKLLDEISGHKGVSRIMASHHDPAGTLSWKSRILDPVVQHRVAVRRCHQARRRGKVVQ